MKSFIYLCRREVWENRNLWIAPLVVAALLIIIPLVALSVTDGWKGSETTQQIIRLHDEQLKLEKQQLKELKQEMRRLERELRKQTREKDRESRNMMRQESRDKEPVGIQILQIERTRAQKERELERTGQQLALSTLSLVENLLGSVMDEEDKKELAMAREELRQEMEALDIQQPATPAPPPPETPALADEPQQAPKDPETAELERKLEQHGMAIAESVLAITAEVLDATAEITDEVAAKVGEEVQTLKQELELERQELQQRAQETEQRQAELDETKRLKQTRLAELKQQIQELNRGIMERSGIFIQKQKTDDKAVHTEVRVKGITMSHLILLYTGLDEERRSQILQGSLTVISLIIYLVLVITITMYSLDSLYVERKDGSALFWKSLPVSDATTVLSKLATALLVAPALAFAAVVITQLVLLIIATTVAWAHGLEASAMVWQPAKAFESWSMLLLWGINLSVWLLPVIGWFLLVSATSRRSPMFFALIIPSAVALIETWLFNSHQLWDIIDERLNGIFRGAQESPWYKTISSSDVQHPLFDDPQIQVTLSGLYEIDSLTAFIGQPAYWGGIVVAAVFIGGAIWVRGNRDES